MHARPQPQLVGFFLLAVAACARDPTNQPPPSVPSPPRIDAAAVAANPLNVLSVVVRVTVHDADSVVVAFHPITSDAPMAFAPAVAVSDQAATVPVLGLLPATAYAFSVIAYGSGGIVVGQPLLLTTGPLPPDLPSYVASGDDPSRGFVAIAAANGKYALVIDNTGRVVWYRYFPDGVGLNFMPQPTGHYVLRPPTPAPGDIEPWVELDVLGNVLRTLNCAAGLVSRPHDLILEPDGGYWIMCDDTRVMDLTSVGGVAAARVTGTVIQHIGAAGNVLFQWSPFDHFAITDLDVADRTGAAVNWTHGNAINLDATGNLIVSFRSLNEITCIDTHSGAVLWRLGGLSNQFTFLDTPLAAFVHQHGVRLRGAGDLVLLDNIGDPVESRAERYILNLANRTARLAQSYGSSPGVRTEIGGSVQALGQGRSLVSFGTAGRVEEVDSTDRLLWHIEGNPGYVFRAQRIHSLYQPGVGDPR